jgi:hypothetical protein
MLKNSSELYAQFQIFAGGKTVKKGKSMPLNAENLCRHANKWNQESKSLKYKY